jgi:hypothetical protein
MNIKWSNATVSTLISAGLPRPINEPCHDTQSAALSGNPKKQPWKGATPTAARAKSRRIILKRTLRFELPRWPQRHFWQVRHPVTFCQPRSRAA